MPVGLWCEIVRLGCVELCPVHGVGGVQEAQGPGVGRDQGEGGAVHGLGGGQHARPHRPLVPAGRNIRA